MAAQRPDAAPFPAPRLAAADPREVAWAACTIAGADARVHDDLRRTLARLRRPRGADEERALLFVLDALVRTGAVVPPKELDFPAEGLLYPVRLRLLAAAPELRAPEVWVEDHRPPAERAAKPLVLPGTSGMR